MAASATCARPQTALKPEWCCECVAVLLYCCGGANVACQSSVRSYRRRVHKRAFRRARSPASVPCAQPLQWEEPSQKAAHGRTTKVMRNKRRQQERHRRKGEEGRAGENEKGAINGLKTRQPAVPAELRVRRHSSACASSHAAAAEAGASLFHEARHAVPRMCSQQPRSFLHR
jgi:hypothetical protein